MVHLDFARCPLVLFFGGGEENAAAPHFPPLPFFDSNPVAERSRGHFDRLAELRVIKL
jgi:hypothetical protein